jgi:hypothetical protein
MLKSGSLITSMTVDERAQPNPVSVGKGGLPPLFYYFSVENV